MVSGANLYRLFYLKRCYFKKRRAAAEGDFSAAALLCPYCREKSITFSR